MSLQVRSTGRLSWALGLLVALGATACGGDVSEAPSTSDAGGDSAGSDLSASLSGAGASFPAPLYQRWFSEYNKENSGVQVSYQSVGSGAGVEQYLSGTVDFGASDAPIKDEERAKFTEQYPEGPVQVPMTSGSVVFAFNLPGVEELKLSREDYCGIVTGKIKTWDDPAITKANPDATLPSQPISWVHRSDGSGTTFLFTTHIEAACSDWPAGSGKSVEWPVGTGAKGNEGITAQIQQTEGAIGYVEYAYAKENGLPAAAIENKSGNIIAPTPESAALVFQGETVPDDFALVVPDPENPDAYPIAGLTWLLLYPKYEDANKAKALKAVMDWSLTDGQKFAEELGYIPLEADLIERVKERISYLGEG
ncbi:Phosphate-binding protein PstS [Acaryochloris thomasi RCC1774]|uniref:Phosphate-binding protein n=1 Tax=Acaryochloris thomasi RCC1774 TaxID=1764569 RepID=A0A2W1JEC5_9CYAN|nr:phosphate ABC transporter substrate-binding protein PstS [Acaryochloris thomasi]PZD72046.1 Phosphate-binding protein PstS [Acaryochloris thomasi RCC1774]